MRTFLIVLFQFFLLSISAQTGLPVDFESGESLADFGGNVSELVTDPVDASNTVVQSIKAKDAAIWAGTTVIGDAGFDTPIPLTETDTEITVRVYSPAAGIPVKLKVEDKSNTALTAETTTLTTAAMQWETLTFDLSMVDDGTNPYNPSTTFDKLSMFFDFGTVGNDAVYLWDDVMFVASDGPVDPMDPDTGVASEYCETQVTHLGIPDQTASAVNLTISSTSDNTMKVTVVSTDGDPVDAIVIPAVTGAPTPGPVEIVDGAYSQTLTWSGTPDENIVINVLWSKESIEGNWQLSDNPGVTVPFAATCDMSTEPPAVVGDPYNFECSTTEYTFDNFGGAVTGVIANPDASGINTSSMVADLHKTDGAQVWAGSFITLDTPLDMSNGMVSMKVWSPKTGAIVRLKLENATDPNVFVELDLTTTTMNAWEELTYDFSTTDASTKELHKIVVFFDFGVGGDDSHYYFDDITVAGNSLDACEPPAVVGDPYNFECSTTEYTFDNFGGAVTGVIANPDASGINTSSMVADLHKTDGAQVWAGSFITLDTPLDMSNGMVSMKVWSPKAGAIVRLKLENATDPNVFVELDLTTTTMNAWEELTYDFSTTDASTKELHKIVVFFDFGVGGDDSHYYFDDITVAGNSLDACEPPALVGDPYNFECSTTEYTFDNFGGAVTGVIANPDASGINTSSMVADLHKTDGAQVWAGSFITLDTPLDMSNGMVSMKVWSPKEGAVVKLKLENATNPDISVELDLTTTTMNTWEELTYDFSTTDASTKELHKIVVFFDFGVGGDDSHYYFDDITVAGNSLDACEPPVEPELNGLVLPLDMECEHTTYFFQEFEGSPTELDDNPDPSGINTSAKVQKLTKANGAATFAGSILTLDEPISFGSETLTMKVWSPKSGITIKLKLENAANGGISAEADAVTTVTEQWEELTFDLSVQDAASKELQKIIVFFDFGNPGDGTTYYFDDIVQGNNTTPATCEAPTMPQEAASYPSSCENVASVYSDAFDTGVSNLNLLNFEFDNVTPTEGIIDEDNHVSISNLGFYIIEHAPLDVTSYTHVTFDYWTPDMTELKIKLVDFGADGFFDGGDDTEVEIPMSAVQGEWVTVNLPLTDFAAMNTENITQYVFSGTDASETLFIDNLYFYGECNVLPACPQLVFEDEFDGESLDAASWTPLAGNGSQFGIPGWGNNELQYYRAENATVSDGKLIITAMPEAEVNEDGYTTSYSSARLVTKDKVDFTYGRVEASIKVPVGQGMWPAFWMLSTDERYGIWPQSGEIDIMEILGHEPDHLFGTIHYGDLVPNNKQTSNSFRMDESFADDFHEFAIEWDVDKITWFVDDIKYAEVTAADIAPEFWPFDQDFHIILNVAVGGNLPGAPNESTQFPQTMEVEYVRVYKGTEPSITGANEVEFEQQGVTYAVENGTDGATYDWTVPAGATLVDGQGTSMITVDWGDDTSSGTVAVTATSDCDPISLELDVAVDIERVEVLECILDNGDDQSLLELVVATGTINQEAEDPTDAENLVTMYARNGDEQFDNFQYSTEVIVDAGPFTTGNKAFSIDVFTEAAPGTVLLLQLENADKATAQYPVGRHSRYQAVTSVSGAWETLRFEFLDTPDGATADTEIDRLVFLLSPNGFTEEVVYFDNFEKYCTDSEAACAMTEVDNCFDRMDFMISDPCFCGNPENILLSDGSVEYFHDILTVDASGMAAPRDISLSSNDGNFLDANGDPLTDATIMFEDDGTGVFTAEFFTAPGVAGNIEVTVNGQTKPFTTESCTQCPITAPKPSGCQCEVQDLKSNTKSKTRAAKVSYKYYLCMNGEVKEVWAQPSMAHGMYKTREECAAKCGAK